MRRWRFALGRRWFGYLAFAVAFAVACVLLSQWQFSRRDEALAEIAKVEQNYDSVARPLEDVLATTDAFEESQEWTPVTMSGTYLVDEQILVRNRPYGGRPGFEVLTPLELENGTVFVVDRGWIPTGSAQDSPDFVPAAPTGQVTVEARLKPGETNLRGRTAPAGQIPTINLPTIAELVGGDIYTGAYGQMVTESPAAADARPAAAVKPEEDEGPHLSYAFQWIIFAFFGFFGLGYALRTEYRLINADDPEERQRALQRQRKAAAKPLSDNDIEDALVEAARR
ncbi:MAG: conserved rane protein [Glaciihabitans sp.]|nr:conserved rane protein [Glaciihabitans sp.]